MKCQRSDINKRKINKKVDDKMEIEVGMYVRAKYYQYGGKIGKIIKNYQNELEIAYKHRLIKTSVSSFIDDNFDRDGAQYKTSYNIIDLIEIGDIVVTKDDHKFEVYAIGEGCVYINNLKEFVLVNEIKSVATKEQFESIEYAVE